MTRLEYLQAVKKLLPPAPVCAEIGVYRGDFSKMILDELEPASLLLVDPFEFGNEIYPDGSRVVYSSLSTYIEILKTFPVIVNPFKGYSFEAAKKYNNYRFNFIYLDHDHRYETMKTDLPLWFELLKSDGIIGGHDYGNEVFTGVKKAVDEFANENKLSITLLSNEGDFALIKNDFFY